MTDQSGACDLPKLRGYADEGDDRMVAMLLAAGADPADLDEGLDSVLHQHHEIDERPEPDADTQ